MNNTEIHNIVLQELQELQCGSLHCAPQQFKFVDRIHFQTPGTSQNVNINDCDGFIYEHWEKRGCIQGVTNNSVFKYYSII